MHITVHHKQTRHTSLPNSRHHHASVPTKLPISRHHHASVPVKHHCPSRTTPHCPPYITTTHHCHHVPTHYSSLCPSHTHTLPKIHHCTSNPTQHRPSHITHLIPLCIYYYYKRTARHCITGSSNHLSPRTYIRTYHSRQTAQNTHKESAVDFLLCPPIAL